MQQQFIEVNQIKLAYIEKNKKAEKTIFFIHGNSVSKRSWRKQYDSELLSTWRVIAIDLPSHGDSGLAPHSNDCTLRGLGAIMSSAVKQLAHDKPYIIAGMSLGTNIVAEMLSFNIDPVGLVLSGPSLVSNELPVETFVKAGTHVGVVFTEDAAENDVMLYARETSASNDEEDINIFMEDYKITDKKFRRFLAESIAEKNYSDEVELIHQRNIPVLIVFGKDEKIVETEYLDNVSLHLWRNEIFKIPGASHLVNIDQPTAFNKLLAEFAQDVFR